MAAPHQSPPVGAFHVGGSWLHVLNREDTTPTTEQIAQLGYISDDVEFSDSQQGAIDRICELADQRYGGFVFLTGRAGTGKSTVLRRLREVLKVVVTAPTGIAAVNVRGVTIHRFFGLPTGPLTKGRTKPLKPPKEDVVRRAQVIAIDEISMVRADLLDGINWSLQKTMENSLPFGGKLILAIGDMAQLEPVVTAEENEVIGKKYKSPFWFDALVFAKNQETLTGESATEVETLELTEIFRQTNPDFIEALNQIRFGDPRGIHYINENSGQPAPGAKPVVLTFGNKRADSINDQHLTALPAEPREFHATWDESFDTAKEKDLPAPKVLTLKVGAQVMVTRNIEGPLGLVANGSVGDIVGFTADGPIVALRDGQTMIIAPATWEKIGYAYDLDKDEIEETVEGGFTQIPLRLAWAITTHKSQGQTLSEAILEMEMPAWSHGQTYVALSRVKSPEGLYLRRPLRASDLIVHPRIREFCGMTLDFDESAFMA